MAALFAKKNYILGQNHNHYRSHPLQKYWAEKVVNDNKFEYLHAEIAAATTVGNMQDLANSTVYVIRVNKLNEIRCSYPCPVCFAFLKHAKVSRIVCCSTDRKMVAIDV